MLQNIFSYIIYRNCQKKPKWSKRCLLIIYPFKYLIGKLRVLSKNKEKIPGLSFVFDTKQKNIVNEKITGLSFLFYTTKK